LENRPKIDPRAVDAPIAENLLSQVDDEGRSFRVLGDITNHCTNGHSLSKDNGFYTTKSGRKKPKCTTRGWELRAKWKDGTAGWLPFKDLKESNPLKWWSKL